MNENTSVEDLLKSLRNTVAERNKKNEEKILDLKDPIKRNLKENHANEFVPKVIEKTVEKYIEKILLEDKNILKNAVINFLSNSKDMEILISNICKQYIEEDESIQKLIKEIAQKNINELFKY